MPRSESASSDRLSRSGTPRRLLAASAVTRERLENPRELRDRGLPSHTAPPLRCRTAGIREPAGELPNQMCAISGGRSATIAPLFYLVALVAWATTFLGLLRRLVLGALSVRSTAVSAASGMAEERNGASSRRRGPGRPCCFPDPGEECLLAGPTAGFLEDGGSPPFGAGACPSGRRGCARRSAIILNR